MPEVGENPQTTLFEFGGLRVLILINHILLGTLLHQLERLGLHPGTHKGGEIQTCIAIQHQVIVHQLVGQISRQPCITQAIPGDLGGQIAQVQTVPQPRLKIQQ